MSSDGWDPQPAISVRDVGKSYQIYAQPRDRLLQGLFRGRRTFYREFWALRHVSFDVLPGESLGIIGRNGSGKSTLLQIIAGTLRPTEGEVLVRGVVGALLELGSGFNPEYTGRENVFMQGAVLGFSRAEIAERYDDIAGFADIGDFLDQPVKTYSTGMFVRLAFAVQAQLEPDILIVDEALAVGDALFQKRCYAKLEELRSRGVTFLIVSHDQEAVRTLTNRAVLLADGRARSLGSPAQVLLDYRALLHRDETRYYQALLQRKPDGRAAEAPAVPRESTGTAQLAFGDLDAEIEEFAILDGEDQPASTFYPSDPMRFRVGVRVHRALTHLNIGLRIRSKEGVKVYSWGTLNQDIAIWSGRANGEVFWDRTFAAGEVVTVTFSCTCALGANWYEVQVGVSEEEDRYYGAQRMLHWRDEMGFFQVNVAVREYFFGGLCDMQMRADVDA